MKKGTKCRVISDSHGFFKTGEIVVALETDDVPYCAKESAYSPGKQISDYRLDEYAVLHDYELEAIDE